MNKPPYPIVHKEFFLDVITNGNSDLPLPVSHEEYFLAAIAGMQIEIPEAVTLKEKYYARILGKNIDIPLKVEGMPRIYYFLAKAAGQDIEIPNPITREERYWSDYSTIPPIENGKINLFPLDSNDRPTDVLYFDALSEAKNYILQHNNDERFWLHVGANAGTSVMDYEMFAGVSGLVKFTNDSNEPFFPIPYISEGAFSGAPDLKEVSMKGIYYIDNNAFKNCASLETVTIELNGIRPQEPEAGFGYGAFSFCNSLQSITIKNMNWIVNGFIRSCPALESIRFLGACQGSGEVETGAIQGALGNSCTLELLSSVETIDNTAFEFCSTLTSIIIHKPANSIPGAPWGAENAVVIWDEKSEFILYKTNDGNIYADASGNAYALKEG